MISGGPKVLAVNLISRTSRDSISNHGYLLRCTPSHSQYIRVICRSIRRRFVRAFKWGFWSKRSHHRDHLVLGSEVLPMEFFLQVTE
jgi:hypothetical protein